MLRCDRWDIRNARGPDNHDHEHPHPEDLRKFRIELLGSVESSSPFWSASAASHPIVLYYNTSYIPLSNLYRFHP